MWEIIGHDKTVDTLKRALEAEALPHALLLSGPVGIGKTRLALELAKTLNCTGVQPPCQRCPHCRQIEAGLHPDVVVVERADGKDSIAIQQVRELRDAASLRPFQGRMKVYIVAGAEALTPQAADALLKTLEEPQGQVVLVLTTTDVDSLPATIVSRCRVLSMRPVEMARIVQTLKERTRDPDMADRIARLAQGKVGWALRAVQHPKLAQQHEEIVARLCDTLDLGLDARLQLAEDLTTDRKDRASVRRNLELMLILARDMLMISLGRPTYLVSPDQQQKLALQAARYELAQIHAYLQRIRLAMRRIDSNVDPRLALEAVLVNAP